MSTGEFFKRTVIVVAVVLVPVLFWFLFDVVLIAIGAILTAVLLRLLAEPFHRWGRFPESIALICSGLLLLAVVGGVGYLFGTRIAAEFSDVMGRVNAAAGSLTTELKASALGRLILAHVQGSSGFSLPSFIGSIFTVSASFLEGVVITLIMGVYLAVQPRLYRTGLCKLFPRRWRANAEETFEDIGNGLRLWLIGELIQMALIGVLTGIAVWLIGLPSPLALAAIAGVAEFIPYLGPILAAVPALLIASTQGLHTVLWTGAAYLLIHQVEGDLIAPIIQRHMVYIPPAVMLLSIVTVLFAFGTVAMIFAAPIAVVVFIAVNKLYIRDSLGEATVIPGENAS